MQIDTALEAGPAAAAPRKKAWCEDPWPEDKEAARAAAVDTGSSALLTMALAPSAWPKSCLHVGLAGDARLRAFRHELGLLEFAMFWKDDAILRFFMGQQRNVAAFVCGQVYLCRFCASIRSLLTLVHTYLHTSASAAGRRVADRMHTNI